MKMISLPNGKFINPAHVESISVHAHFFNSKKFYVQMSLKNGSTKDIAERLDHEKALAIQEEYKAKVCDCCGEIDAYQLGHDDGRRAGYDDRYKKGRQEGVPAKNQILQYWG